MITSLQKNYTDVGECDIMQPFILRQKKRKCELWISQERLA